MGTAPRQETETTVQETVGSRLRRERLSKQLTLDEAAASTRVNSKMLRALEENDKANLPARVYVQGFIRIYAQYLGLNPQALLEQYAIDTDQTVDSRSKINVRQVLSSESMAENPAFMGSKQILLLVLCALLVVLLYLGRQMHQPAQPTGSVQQPAMQAELPSEPPAAEPAAAEPETAALPSDAPPAPGPDSVSEPTVPIAAPTAPAAESAPPPEPAPAAEPAPATERPSYLLRARFTERTWMWIKVDDAEPREYTFEAGQRYRWTAHEQIDLNLGNAGGVELTLNGKKIPQIGISGQVVRVKVPEATQTLLNGGDAR